MRINFQHVASQTKLPPNIVIIRSTDRAEAFHQMREALSRSPVNTAVWLRASDSMSKLFQQCEYLATRKKFRKVFYDASHQNFSEKLRFGQRAGAAEFIKVDALVDELAETSQTAQNLWGGGTSRINILSLTNYNRPTLDKHIDAFREPSFRIVQPLLKPETILFDNDTFDTIRINNDGRKLWQVAKPPFNGQTPQEIDAYLVPQGSMVAISGAHSDHVPAVHAHGMTQEGQSVPRMTVKLDVKL